MKKQYQIAGKVLEISSDFEAETAEKTELFATENQELDFIVRLEETISLEELQTPDISNDYDSKISVHEEAGGMVQVFHEGLCGEMFARAYLDYGTNCETVRYLKRGLRQFEKMEHLFDWIGIDNIFAGLETVILHAAFVSVSGEGVLFMGPSGVGKSTRADLWHRFLGAKIINGDRTFVNRDADGVWRAYGSPYSGSSGYHVNESAPIRAVMSVRRGGENEVSIQRLTGARAFSEIYKNVTVHQWNSHAVNEVSSMIMEMIADVPVYEMICPPDIRAVENVRKELGMDT